MALINLKRHGWALFIIFFFLLLSYFIISSDYEYAHGDGGVYARSAKIFYETHKIDITYSASSLIGQVLFSDIFCRIFGFRLKILNISVYIVNFLLLAAMYFLLVELGLSPFLSLIGSLTLLINPVSLKMVDWYMTEPFFMCYLVISILFFIKGIRRDKYLFLYIGSIFCILAVLTRQYAVSVSIALLLLCIFFRKEIKKGTIAHCLIASALPILFIGLFYLTLLGGKGLFISVPYSTAISGNLSIIKSFASPLKFFLRLYFDTVIFLHYIPLYLAPLSAALILFILMNPSKIKDFSTNFPVLIISISFISIGTIIRYLKFNHSMPYLSSIFFIRSLTKVFKFPILSTDQATFFLTIFSLLGAIIILIKILEYFFYRMKERNFLYTNKKNRQTTKRKEGIKDCGEIFLYLWGIVYMLLSISIGLLYDRYVYPVSILMIYMVLSHFPWIKIHKKSLIGIFIIFYSVFIFEVASSRLNLDLQWKACNSIIHEGMPSYKINGGLGFNQFYSFDYITDLYKNVKTKNHINWYKYHPLADCFVTGADGLENKNMNLVLYKSLTQKRLFGLLKGKCFIYMRKEGYTAPILI